MKMRFKNTTDWPDYFIRRMLAWCVKELELPKDQLWHAHFGKRSRGCFNGRASICGRKIRVMIGPAEAYPVKGFLYPGRTDEAYRSPDYADQIEGLIGVTAHEITHLRQWVARKQSGRRTYERGLFNERATRYEERRVLALFQSQREALLAAWGKAQARAELKPKLTAVEKRAIKAQADLARWQRKLKLAQTKVKKLRAKAKYYERTAAMRGKGAAPDA